MSAPRCYGEWLLNRAAEGLPHPGDCAEAINEVIASIREDDAAHEAAQKDKAEPESNFPHDNTY